MKRKRPRNEKVDWQEPWEIGWWRRDFRKLRRDPAFHAVVTLTRLGNMLRFVQGVVITIPQGVALTPEQRRQMMNAFYLGGALLVEAEKTVEGLGRHFAAQDEYRALARTIHEGSFQDVVDRFRKMRKWSAFHFDVKAAAEALEHRSERFVRFMSAQGTLKKDLYYDLADVVALSVVVGTFESREAFEGWFKEWLGSAAGAVNALMDRLDEFVSRVAADWGAVQRQVRED